jgi:hypothetical protein
MGSWRGTGGVLGEYIHLGEIFGNLWKGTGFVFVSHLSFEGDKFFQFFVPPVEAALIF